MAEALNSLFKAELIRNKGPGCLSMTSRSPSPSTSTGTTTGACTARSAWSRPSNTRGHTAPQHPLSTRYA